METVLIDKDCNNCRYQVQGGFRAFCRECLATEEFIHWAPTAIEKVDAVEHPKHYEVFPDGTEAIELIRKCLTTEEFIGYCKGNYLKYRLRAGKKDDVEQEIAKSEKYNEFMGDVL